MEFDLGPLAKFSLRTRVLDQRAHMSTRCQSSYWVCNGWILLNRWPFGPLRGI